MEKSNNRGKDGLQEVPSTSGVSRDKQGADKENKTLSGSNNTTLTKKPPREILNKAERKKMIKLAHDYNDVDAESNEESRHFSRAQTYSNLVGARVTWESMKKDVKMYVKECQYCQEFNERMNVPERNQSRSPSPMPQTWRYVEVDLCLLTQSHDGFLGVIVVRDTCTNWIEASPFKTPNSKEVADFLFYLICRHGYPKINLNNQSRQYCRSVWERLKAYTGVEVTVTLTPFSRHYDPFKESKDTALGSLLRNLKNEKNRWTYKLQEILLMNRTTVHKDEEHSPFEMMYGRKAVTPLLNPEEIDLSKLKNVVLDPKSAADNLEAIPGMFTVDVEECQDDVVFKKPKLKIVAQKKKSNVGTSQSSDKEGDAMTYDSSFIASALSKTISILDGAPGVFLQYPKQKKDFKTVKEINSYNRGFLPTNRVWRETICKVLNLVSEGSCDQRIQSSYLGTPKSVDTILGDGNCLFRAISKEITLSEEHHALIRKYTVDFIITSPYSPVFSALINGDTSKYVSDSQMDENGIWGTEVEVMALATMLHTPIVIYTRRTNGDSSWERYPPVDWLEKGHDNLLARCVYLDHTGNHFNRVLSVTPKPFVLPEMTDK